MKFGKKLRHTVESSLPEWRGKWVAYKKLKKSIPDPPAPIQTPALPLDSEPGAPSSAHPDFLGILDNELAKVNDFYLDKQEDHVIHYHVLASEVARILSSDATPPTRSHLVRLKSSLVDFHGELVLLENYSAVNCTGFRKILKKHDKKSGASIRDSYLPAILFTPVNTSSTISELLTGTESLLEQLNNANLQQTDTPRTPPPLDTFHSHLRLKRVYTSLRAILPITNVQDRERIMRKLDSLSLVDLGLFSYPTVPSSPACFILSGVELQSPLTVACLAIPARSSIQMLHLAKPTRSTPLFSRVLAGTVSFQRYTQIEERGDGSISLDISANCTIAAPWPSFQFSGVSAPHVWTALSDTLIIVCVEAANFLETDFPIFRQATPSSAEWLLAAKDQSLDRYHTHQQPRTSPY